MKALLAFTSGFALSVALFGLGAGAAVYFINAEPARVQQSGQDVAQLWSATPRPVDTRSQPLERVAPVQSAHAAEAPVVDEAAFERQPEPAIDEMQTSAVDPGAGDPALRRAEEAVMARAHEQWCGSRYRSYRPHDDSFTPYEGGRRPCISPYSQSNGELDLETISVDAEIEASDDRRYDDASARVELVSDSGWTTSDHIDSCFARYRSYRPEDNSYQPYGGGPRLQCD